MERYSRFLTQRLGGGPSTPAIVITLALGFFYIARSRALFLPDGYIFLAYARQIATGLNWGINPGEVSFGTSSPLWTIVCALVYFVSPAHFDFVRVMQVVGLMLMAGVLPLIDSILRSLDVTPVSRTLAIGIYAAVPFNGLFYSIAAMETPLYLFLFFCAVRVALSPPSRTMAALFGVLSGLLFLTRPEGALCAVAFAVLIASGSLSSAKKLELVVLAGLCFVCLIAPWQAFMFFKAGIVLPTSGSGRLFLYFPIPGLEPSQYISLGVLQRLSYFRQIFHSNFIDHPLQLMVGVLPVLGIVMLCGFGHFVRITTRPRRAALLFLTVYNVLNVFIYFVFQPLIFQRYLVAAVPSFLVCLLASVPWQSTAGTKRRATTSLRMAFAAAGVLALVAVNWFGLRYFDVPTRQATQIINLFERVDASLGNAPCRLAAEPLGMAAYFTRCYIVDLGGLINPDLWPYWIHAGRRQLDRATAQYAIDRHADLIYSPDGSPPRNPGAQFELRYQVSRQWAIFEYKGPAKF